MVSHLSSRQCVACARHTMRDRRGFVNLCWRRYRWGTPPLAGPSMMCRHIRFVLGWLRTCCAKVFRFNLLDQFAAGTPRGQSGYTPNVHRSQCRGLRQAFALSLAEVRPTTAPGHHRHRHWLHWLLWYFLRYDSSVWRILNKFSKKFLLLSSFSSFVLHIYYYHISTSVQAAAK